MSRAVLWQTTNRNLGKKNCISQPSIIFSLTADLTWYEQYLQSVWDADTAPDTAGGTGGKHWADAASASLEQAKMP